MFSISEQRECESDQVEDTAPALFIPIDFLFAEPAFPLTSTIQSGVEEVFNGALNQDTESPRSTDSVSRKPRACVSI